MEVESTLDPTIGPMGAMAVWWLEPPSILGWLFVQTVVNLCCYEGLFAFAWGALIV